MNSTMEAKSCQIVKATALKSSVVNVVDLTSKDENIPIDLTDKFERGEDIAPLQYHDEIDEDSDSERWESESLYEDALEGIGNEQYIDGGKFRTVKMFSVNIRANVAKAPDSCTLDEALTFCRRLRQVGEDQFIIETIEAGTITAKKLCTAFGIRPPAFLEGAPDVSSLTFPWLLCGV